MGGKHESQCLIEEFRVVSSSSARTDFLNALYIFYQSLRLCVLLLEAVQAESCVRLGPWLAVGLRAGLCSLRCPRRPQGPQPGRSPWCWRGARLRPAALRGAEREPGQRGEPCLWVGNYFPERMSRVAWYWLPKRTTGGRRSGTGNITGTSQEALSVSILRYARESLSQQQQYFIHIGKILKNRFGFDCLKLTLGIHHTKLDDFFGDLYLKSVLKELHSYLLKDFIKLETKLSCHQIH